MLNDLQAAFELFKKENGKIQQIEVGETAKQYPCLFCEKIFMSIELHEAHVYQCETYEMRQIQKWLDRICPDLEEFADKHRPEIDREDTETFDKYFITEGEGIERDRIASR